MLLTMTLGRCGDLRTNDCLVDTVAIASSAVVPLLASFVTLRHVCVIVIGLIFHKQERDQ